MDLLKARSFCSKRPPKFGSKVATFAPAYPQPLGPRARHVDARQSPHQGSGIARAAQMRIWQDRRQQRRLPRRQAYRGVAERMKAPRLGAELAGGTKFGNV